MNRSGRSARWSLPAALVAFALVVAACGGGDDGGGGGDGAESAGDPVYGGEVAYGLEAESTGGWCLPEAQLAISGIMVARAIYDTLTVPNAEGEFVPFLAESVEPNDTFDEWTITLRDGVTFHDGTDLDATVVKNNLDAYRGQYEGRSPLLFVFVFDNITSVDVVDDLTLTISTATPWPALPATLYTTGRVGIMAQAQLDDPDTCDANLIGTGPFAFEDWQVNSSLSATRNPDYWLEDPDGNQLPFLDRVEFRPVLEETVRTNSLLNGELQEIIQNTASELVTLNEEAEAGNIRVANENELAEVSYMMFNVSKPPFDNQTARTAVATAMDTEAFGTERLQDQFDIASGPFAPGAVGYVEDAGLPQHDTEEAEALAAQYEDETGEPLEFTLTFLDSPDTLLNAQYFQQQLAEAGIEVNLDPIEQSVQISTAIGDEWDAQLWRNHPGSDPDTQRIWWTTGSPVNFNKIADPELDALLDQGRAETDPEARAAIYEDVNRLFGEKVYNVWLNWSRWTVGAGNEVQGNLLGPNNPDGSEPLPELSDGHSLANLWISE